MLSFGFIVLTAKTYPVRSWESSDCIARLVLHKLLRPCAAGPLGKVGRAVEKEVYMVCAGDSDTCVIGFESHFAANS